MSSVITLIYLFPANQLLLPPESGKLRVLLLRQQPGETWPGSSEAKEKTKWSRKFRFRKTKWGRNEKICFESDFEFLKKKRNKIVTMISLSRPQEEPRFEDEDLNLNLLNGFGDDVTDDVTGVKIVSKFEASKRSKLNKSQSLSLSFEDSSHAVADLNR